MGGAHKLLSHLPSFLPPPCPPLPLPLPTPVEWCRSEMFAPIVGEFVMTDLRSTEYIIPDLNKVRGRGMGVWHSIVVMGNVA